MSAFLVDEIHINLIVTAAIDLGLFTRLPPANDGVTITQGNAEDFGRMLWAENARSVAYRYPLDDHSEPNAEVAGYKETTARLAAEHGFKITNPEMQDRIQQLRAEAESKKSSLAEGAPEVEKTQAGPAPAITTMPAERSLHLASIRERVDLEAERETTQAGAPARAAETSKAESDAATPERAPQEAAAPREAARTVDSDKSTPMQPNPAQSEEMQQLRHAQQRVLTQEQRDRQELAIRNREAFREQQSRKTENESEGQSE